LVGFAVQVKAEALSIKQLENQHGTNSHILPKAQVVELTTVAYCYQHHNKILTGCTDFKFSAQSLLVQQLPGSLQRLGKTGGGHPEYRLQKGKGLAVTNSRLVCSILYFDLAARDDSIIRKVRNSLVAISILSPFAYAASKVICAAGTGIDSVNAPSCPTSTATLTVESYDKLVNSKCPLQQLQHQDWSEGQSV
jgi:hypothetical protein